MKVKEFLSMCFLLWTSTILFSVFTYCTTLTAGLHKFLHLQNFYLKLQIA